MRFFYHNPELGPSFIRRLFSEMKITLTRNNRQGLDWLGVGKFQLSLFFPANRDYRPAIQPTTALLDDTETLV